MHALVIVTLTLSGLAGVLFGSDVLDRRLTIRSGLGAPDLAPASDAPVTAPTAAFEPAPAPTPAATPARHASLVRPVAPCHHCRSGARTSPTALRTPGPLRVPASH